MLDVVFPLTGAALPRDHRFALARALHGALPAFAHWPQAGAHAVKLPAGNEADAPLPGHARLVLRVPRAQAGALGALSGTTLDVGGHALTLGHPAPRELRAHAALYAEFVVAEGFDDEAAFLAATEAHLRELDVSCRSVCGRRVSARAGARVLHGCSLMLYELDADDALRVLEHGIGDERRLGCGLFVAHRNAAAVGT